MFTLTRGSAPGAAAGIPTHIQDADADTLVHTEFTSDEDVIRGRVAGIERLIIRTTGPHIQLTGNSQIGGSADIAAFGGGTVSNQRLTVYLPTSGTASGLAITGSTTLSSTGQTLTVLAGTPTAAVGATAHNVDGLNFAMAVGIGGAGTSVNRAANVYAYLRTIFFSGTITEYAGLYIAPPLNILGPPTITEAYGVDIQGLGKSWVTTAYGIRVRDQSGAASGAYLMQLDGATTSNLQVAAGDPVNLGSATEARSALGLAFNENGSVLFRNVRWKQQSTLAGTDRVLVAV